MNKIDELLELAKKATPGQWISHRDGFSTVYIESQMRPGTTQELAACGPTEVGQEQQWANSRLISETANFVRSDEFKALVKDAERYRFWRVQHWSESEYCIAETKRLALGSATLSFDLLDEYTDSAMEVKP